jgi:hypothetical protein
MGCEKPIDKETAEIAQKETPERGARLRSEFLDAFARLEEAIVQKLGNGEKVALCQSLSQKLTALEKAPFKSPAKAKQRIVEIRKLIECRNDIVHSALAIAEIVGDDATSYFIFRNVATKSDDTGKMLRALTSKEFKSLISRVKTATKHLNDQPMKEATPTARASATARAA